ncbi:hypothetical protein BH09CHL1_BH09CHL1_20940 [soil metagenome]
MPFEETTQAPRNPNEFLVGHSRQYDDIADAIDSRRPPTVDVSEALLSLALVKAIYRSSELHAPVLIADV